MKLTNRVIVALVQAGAMNLTANSLDESQAYKVIKLRRAVSKAFGVLCDEERSIIEDCGLAVGEKGIVEGEQASREKYGKLREELYNDEQDLGDIKAISYSAWHALKNENKELSSAYIEDALAGVFWLEPQE